jgi:F-type H+-transporting ATPase subunit a
MSVKIPTWLKLGGIGVVLFIMGLLFPLKLPPIEAGPLTIFDIHIGGFEFPVSNSLLVSWIVMAFLIVLAYFSTRRMQLVPSGLQNVMELVIEALNGLVSDVAGAKGRRFFPFVATFFLFVLFSNLTEILPGFGPIGIWRTGEDGARVLVPLFRTPSADLNMTVALAIISVFTTQVFGIMALGLVGYASKFLNFGKLITFVLVLLGRRPRQKMAGLLIWGIIDVITGVIELFSEMVKILTFSFRLFGNMFAGEVLLIVMAFFLTQILPLPFYLFETFVGFIQAFVFAMLTLVFMSMATTHMGSVGGPAEH